MTAIQMVVWIPDHQLNTGQVKVHYADASIIQIPAIKVFVAMGVNKNFHTFVLPAFQMLYHFKSLLMLRNKLMTHISITNAFQILFCSA